MSQSNDRPVINVTTAIFITFLVLKLTGVIAWSWWWITAPLWMPVATLATLALILIVITGVAGMVAAWIDK